LNVFLDENELLRVGGRIKNSRQSFDMKHQIVLPKQHHFTKSVIRYLHEKNGHVGQQAFLSIVRQTYWPLSAKDIVRNITRNCIKCFRMKPKPTEQLMGDLPTYRVTSGYPFLNAGVDYAGPLLLKVNRRTTTKAYLSIFVCLATKAVHLEVVSELSTQESSHCTPAKTTSYELCPSKQRTVFSSDRWSKSAYYQPRTTTALISW
jgi:hypothetical protein